MRFMRLAAVLAALAAGLAGCNSVTVTPRTQGRSYVVGAPIVTTVGAPMVAREDYAIVTVKRWVGLAFSPDGYQTVTGPTNDSVKEELIYTGRAGSAIRVSYREFRGNLIRPAFAQELQYDLAQSPEITFRNFRIFVEAADNNEVRFRVLRD